MNILTQTRWNSIHPVKRYDWKRTKYARATRSFCSLRSHFTLGTLTKLWYVFWISIMNIITQTRWKSIHPVKRYDWKTSNTLALRTRFARYARILALQARFRIDSLNLWLVLKQTRSKSVNPVRRYDHKKALNFKVTLWPWPLTYIKSDGTGTIPMCCRSYLPSLVKIGRVVFALERATPLTEDRQIDAWYELVTKLFPV